MVAQGDSPYLCAERSGMSDRAFSELDNDDGCGLGTYMQI